MNMNMKKTEDGFLPYTTKEIMEMSEGDFRQLKWLVGVVVMGLIHARTYGNGAPFEPCLIFDAAYLKQTGFYPSDAWSQIEKLAADLKRRGYIGLYGPFLPSGHDRQGNETFSLDCGDEDDLNKAGFYKLRDDIIKVVEEKKATIAQANDGRARFDWVIKKLSDGTYTYDGRPLDISPGTDPQRALDALIEVADERGIASFTDINNHMVRMGSKRLNDNKKIRTRISHSIDTGQGFLFHGRIGPRRLKDVLRDSKIIKNIVGKGYQLKNL